MSRKKKSDNGDTATIDDAPAPMEQADLFPELDESDPRQKALLRAAKAYYRAKADRDALLSTAKEKVDGAMQWVIGLMHECGVEKFKYKGVVAELIPSKEKVEVEMEDDGE